MFTQWSALNTNLSHCGASLGGSTGRGGHVASAAGVPAIAVWLRGLSAHGCALLMSNHSNRSDRLKKRRRGHFAEQLSAFESFPSLASVSNKCL